VAGGKDGIERQSGKLGGSRKNDTHKKADSVVEPA
jgi:hypothetical protein